MSVFGMPLVLATAWVGLILLSAGVVVSFVRLWRGPSLPDRVVALDAVGTLLVGLLVLHGIAYGGDSSLRVATVLALINFVGTIGFAYYLQRSQAK